ncbi:prepilin peptidase [Candidatus Falkowbacteria bacterium]|nr:prepilin peptidase [Candidatus Falkowbacteria bacterium]
MFYVFIFLLGLIVGSFLNVEIFRLKSGEKIINSRSHCQYCRHQLKAKDLVPVLSFIFYGGKCAYCRKRISWQYPLVELATTLLFLVVFMVNLRHGINPEFNFQFLIPDVSWGQAFNFQFWLKIIRDWIFISFLVVIFVFDLRWYEILDKVTIPAMVLALVLNLMLGVGWQGLLIGAAIGFFFFLFQFVVSKGKWIGGGDLRLGLLMGLMLGWPKIILGLFLAYIIGAIFSIILIKLNKKDFKSQIQFGTFLSAAAIIAILWGDEIVRWYLKLIL